MACRLSIRSYTFAAHSHSHHYHQLVLPLAGVVDVNTETYQGRLYPGTCILYPANVEHHFSPAKDGCYFVADLDELPDSLASRHNTVHRVSKSVLAFCQFAQVQLEHQVNEQLTLAMGDWFVQLLESHEFLPLCDPRISKVIEYLDQELSATPSLSTLASIACLSLSQFKVLFKKEMALTPLQYLFNQRMDKAKALLLHTDYPIKVIASQVGYQDSSTFSHRFSSHFNFSPSKLRSQR